MLKKEVFLLVLVILACSAYSEISDSFKLGEIKQYLTANQNITAYFREIDPLKERAEFVVNGEVYNMLPMQSTKIGNVSFIFMGMEGSSFSTVAADIILDGYVPFECVRECENSSFVDFLQIFFEDFELCKRDCSEGCSLYKEIKCVKNEIWVVDNCREQEKKLESCGISCINAECTYCGNSRCEFPETYFNCKDCRQNPGFCIGDTDCQYNQECVSGQCSSQQFTEGDGICSYPYEKCSSEDCSCGAQEAEISRNNNPIIIIHGFSSDASKLKKLQNEISFDLGYTHGGEIAVDDIDCVSHDKNIVYTATYYEIPEKKSKDIPAYLENAIKKYSRKENNGKNKFVDKFARIIDKAKACSNSDKVTVIAHSWGGIIARQYLLREDNIKNVDKLIMLGTLNHGEIYGEQKYELIRGLETTLGERRALIKECSNIGLPAVVLSFIDGRDVTNECEQIHRNPISSSILSIDETPGPVEYYTIAGKIDEMGDGMVTADSVKLEGAVFNRIVPCGHFDLKNPGRCIESYRAVIEALGYEHETTIKSGIMNFIKRSFHSLLS
ncbi:alpha/beta fold hydrolase [Candidatus Woesearchaeota archaeon]|nr:alpha/beta fold hydrolase [Candidatus Woesearchaeota archaeon]